ncbi:uncharacterized protein IL334_006999 [Kwoniella shivajii]|uniref:Uncharacterized protein n=1 Tax=Kwoniella shivajii TaxID=564305 RepID=A0ABZ1D881_9TREE|nr:hypothetical protein IL334_006999 [Kwoniella shivajii]
MAFSSLADELEEDLEDDHLHSDFGPGIGIGQSLAAEFGLEYTLNEGEEGVDHVQGSLDPESQHQTTPPNQFQNLPLPSLHTPTHQNSKKRNGKSSNSYSPTISDDISPDRGIDSDLELESELNDRHSFSPPDHRDHHRDHNLDEVDGNNPWEGYTINPVRNENTHNQSSSISLGQIRKDQLQELNPLIVLSETLALNSRFLSSLKQLDHSSGDSMNYHHGYGSIEDRLHKHLDRMLDIERRRDESMRELGVMNREAGGSGIGIGKTTGGFDHNVILEEDDDDEDEDEEDEISKIGWTGELDMIATNEFNYPSNGSINIDKDKYDRVETAYFDSWDGSFTHQHCVLPSYPSNNSTSLATLTPSTSTTSATPTGIPLLPRLIHLVQSDTTSLLISLQHLSDSLHTSSSLNTSLTRQIRGIRSSVESWRERETIEDEARKKIEEWEESRVRDGLKGQNMKDKLHIECFEFEKNLEAWYKRLEACKRSLSTEIR